MPDPQTLRKATDTYAASTSPSTNRATEKRLGLRDTTAYTYIYFTRPFPLGAVITTAKLRVFYDSTWTATTIKAERLASAFTASRLTWNAKPNVVTNGATGTANAPAGAVGTVVEIDVKAIMQQVADGAAWYGLRLSSPGTLRWLTSSEGLDARRPELYVAWSEAPHAPTNLAPDANLAVAEPKPLLRFQVTDTLGDTTLAGVHVQTSATPSFTTPAWDSGWVTTGDPELDLATTSFPALTNGQSIYWRVQVKDGAGLVSAWSDDAQLRYVTTGTLTVLSPSAGVVTEPTPPIVWEFTGRTQEQFQVLIYDPTKPSKILANSGIRTSTETEWTPPKDVITTKGLVYRVVVRVWDTVDRDPLDAFVEQSADFTLTSDLATNGVTGLAVSQPNPWPGIALTWSRTSAPDSFVIERDGVILDEVDPEEVIVSGTSYRFEDPNARAWIQHTWKVYAKVNKKISDSTVVTVTPTLRGIWLMNLKRGIRVWIAGAEDGSFTQPEDATALAPLGASSVVRRVQGVRNIEGNISGLLVDAYGRTMRQYVDDLVKLRDEPDDKLTLALADYSIRVIIGNVQFAPTAEFVPPQRTVSFDFWQV